MSAVGTEVIHMILALHTPLQLVTVGSGSKLITHTCPTYPSLLHTHTSLCGPSVGAAHVIWSPALVLRMGIEFTNSGTGKRSMDAVSFCFAS